jgi:glycosyltransferase involved in cell wall biosynthesis
VTRILHIISNLTPGGAESNLAKLVEKMDRKRFHHTVVSLGDRGTMADAFEADGAEIRTLNLKGPASLIGGLRRLKKLAREAKPNWIQGWMVHGNLAARFLRGVVPDSKIAWNIRHTLDNLENEKLRTRALIKFSAMWSKRADLILSNSVAGSEDHERIGYPKAKRKVIPNGFDLDRFRPNPEARAKWRAELGIPDEAILIGNAARFHPMKHQTQLVRAAAELDGAHVLIMGRWIKENEQLLALAKELGVTNRLHLLDHQLALEEVHSALDVFCLCSKAAEGFPTVVGEAMACGVPAVVTDVGDAALIVGETGIVVPKSDLKALVSALGEMIERVKNDRESIANACRERIRDNFALAKVIAEYESLYASPGA